ncbi:WD domain [Trypanosoma vivax]|uniref:Uncharacterized protein n=1 Tax=Trypanosoma vivax (strain Y486) TaxID=1055687 RepID=G0TYD2_TRYVY|nr:hypothetical protein TRVL_05760 [Trypanosoma vivax]KAH8619670.1 WD domain [Trypanosoma vivax]CCC48979.1 conserved hypothetical protein [Trypanosoma vivax Y486]
MLLSLPRAHEEVVTSLQFSPYHTSIICSTSGDDTAALWDLRLDQDECCIARLVHHRQPTNHALFLESDGRLLLTASDDRTIACWDMRQLCQPVGEINGFGGGINKMLLAPATVPERNERSQTPLLVSACDDGSVYLHSLNLGAPIAQNGHGAAEIPPLVPAPTASPSVSTPVVGSLVNRFLSSTSTVNDVVLSPNPNHLLTASEDHAVRLWCIFPTAGGLVTSFDEFENPVNHVAVRHHEEGLLPSGVGRTSNCWVYAACSECVFAVDLDPSTGAFGDGARTFTGHRDYVRGLEFIGPDTLLTVSDDSTAIEWSIRTTHVVRQVRLHEGFVMASATSAACDLLVTGTDEGEMRVWRLPFRTETCCDAIVGSK